MAQSHTTISIDSDVLRQAQNSQINISSAAQSGIMAKMNVKEVSINTSGNEKCVDCKKEERKATAEDLNGLTWLWPDEVWICNSCLSRRSRHIVGN